MDLDGSNKFQKLLKYLYIPQTLNSASTNLLYKTYSWKFHLHTVLSFMVTKSDSWSQVSFLQTKNF